MKPARLDWGLVLALGLTSTSACRTTMDREDLVLLMNRYLEALAEHDPSAVPLAAAVKPGENTEVTPVGEGLWKTATGGPTDFRIFVADPTSGKVGFIGVVGENR